jgi:hypothetical protein
VHRTDECIAIGDVELLLPGLAVLCETNGTAPASTAGPLDSNRIVRQIRAPGVAVSLLCTVDRVLVLVLAFFEAHSVTGSRTSFSTEIPRVWLDICFKPRRVIYLLEPLAHSILNNVADVRPVLLVHEAIRDHDLILVVARPRNRTAVIIVPGVGDTLGAIDGGTLKLEDVFRQAVSPSAIVVGGKRVVAGAIEVGAGVTDSDRGYKCSELQEEEEKHFAAFSLLVAGGDGEVVGREGEERGTWGIST